MDKKDKNLFKNYNIIYYDDFNKKHLAYNLSPNDLKFIYNRYGKNNVQLTSMSHQFNSKIPAFQAGYVGAAPTWGF